MKTFIGGRAANTPFDLEEDDMSEASFSKEDWDRIFGPDRDEEEARFQEAIPKSFVAARAVAEHLRCLGYVTQTRENGVRPDRSQNRAFRDSEDVLFRRPTDFYWRRAEVKWRTHDFPPWPAHWKTIFVDRLKEDQSPADIYVSVNVDLTHFALVRRRKTEHAWTSKDVFDSTKGYWVKLYECPIELAEFIELRREPRE